MISAGRMVGWLVGWLFVWLVGWLFVWLVGWLVGCSAVGITNENDLRAV